MGRFSARARKLLARVQASSDTPGIPFSDAVPFLPDNPVIVEAGASIGMDLPELSALWPRGTVHAFEPEPSAYRELRKRASALPNVQAWNVALGRVDSTIEMNVSHGSYGTTSSSLLAPTIQLEAHPDMTFSSVAVEQRNLAAWARDAHVDRVDMLALDMQGSEYAALDAAREVLRGASVVITEAFLVELYANAPTVERIEALLTTEGFVILKTQIYYARTFEVLAVRRDALEDAIVSGRLQAHGSVATS